MVTLRPGPTVARASWDGISLEILRSRLDGICAEAYDVLVASGRSPSLRERHDCSVSLYSADGQMAVQAEHIPVHLGIMPFVVRRLCASFDPRTMRAGQVFVTNDPYAGAGNHLPDLVMIAPLYLGSVLAGFAASVAHHADVGGSAPRSMAAEATEIFQEGLRIPLLEIADGNGPREDLVAMICLNSRTPTEMRSDLSAQIAGMRMAQMRMNELAKEYTATELADGIRQLLDRSETAMRHRIGDLADGVFEGRAQAEDGVRGYEIRVAVTIAGTDLIVDFSGTSEQSTGPFNATAANTWAVIMTCLRNALGDDVPPNAGLYRPLDVVLPPGSIVDAAFPAAIAATTQVSYHTYDAVMSALGHIVPAAVMGEWGAGGVYSWGGTNPRTGALYAYGEALGGGGGALAGRDGEDCVMPPFANLRDTSAESLEQYLPVLVERYEIRRGSEGAGTYRGGRGLRRVIRNTAASTWTVQISRSLAGTAGAQGGGSGQATRCRIERADGTTEDITGFTRFHAAAGDVVVIETAGGGGFGAVQA